MNCDTSTRPVLNVTLYGPRACRAEVLRFIRGIRGRRENPVTRAQIGKWLFRTPADAIDAALLELVAEGVITCGALSLRTPSNSHRRAYGYEVAP
jgi:hypothetical protein